MHGVEALFAKVLGAFFFEGGIRSDDAWRAGEEAADDGYFGRELEAAGFQPRGSVGHGGLGSGFSCGRGDRKILRRSIVGRIERKFRETILVLLLWSLGDLA